MQLHRAVLIGVPVVAMVVTVACLLRLQSLETAGRNTGTAAKELRPLMVPAGSGTATADDSSVLREEVASLRVEVLQLRKEQIARSGGSADNSRQPRPGPQNAAESNGESGSNLRGNEMTREEEAGERQAWIATIDASFRKEVIDPTWSASTSSRIQSVLSSDDIGHMQADSIDCRSDSCRVELHDDASARLNKNMPIVALRLAGTLPNITADSVRRPDGGVSMVLYLSRQPQGAPPVTR
jgi:hypothetical protein